MRSVLALLTIFAASGLANAADDPAITVWAGAGGYVRDDCVAPVFVQLNNTKTQYNGYISVQFFILGTPIAEARRNLELPPNSRKDHFLYVPNMGRQADRITVSYHNARGRVVSSVEERLRSVDKWLPVIAALGTLPTGLPSHETEKGEALYTRLYLDEDRMLIDSIGLEMFDAIILSPPPESALERQQVDALHDWTMRGGTLVVDASERTDAFGDGGLAAMLPFVPERISTLNLSELRTEETITEGRIEHADVILLESDGKPLIVRRNYGLGTVTTFAISPDARGMKKWEGREAVWQNILSGLRIAEIKPTKNEPERGEEEHRRVLMDYVRAEQQTGLRLGLVLALTLIYALVVGPGDYFFIKWLGKPKMTWVTFPAIVVVFTAAAWWGAKAWVGGDMTSMHVRRTIVFPELATATQYDLMGLFVPAGRRYTINHQDGAHLQEIRSTMAPGEGGVYDVDAATLEQRIPIWKSRIYGASMEPEEYPHVDLLVEQGEGSPIVTVSNQSDRTLRGNSIVRRGRTWRIPNNISPGEKVELSLVPGESRPRNNVSVRNRMLFGLAMEGNEHWAYGRQFDLRDAMRRGAIVFVSDDAGPTKTPLVVDGEARPETSRELLQVVTYPRSVQ